MQIHEITQIQEGVLGTIGRDIAGAVTTPFKKANAILSTPGALTSPGAAGAAMDQYYRGQVAKNQDTSSKITQQATKQWAERLAKEWKQTSKSLPDAPGLTDPGQMSATMAASKTGQQMQQMFGAPRGGIQGMQSDIEEATQEYTTPSGIVVPGGSKTDQLTSAPTDTPFKSTTVPSTLPTQYKQSFLDWVNKKTTTRIPGTNINLTAKKAHDEGGPVLDSALNKVLATQDNPAANQQAVQQYLLQLAQVMQKMSADTKAQIRQKPPSADTVSPLSDLLPDSTIEQIKARAEDPVNARAIKQMFGLR